MRRTARLVLWWGLVALLGACGSGSNSSDEPDWESISSPAGRFSVDFPVEPRRQTQRVPAAGEPLELIVYTAETADEALSVSYVDYRAPAASVDEANTILDAAAEGAASALQGQNLTKKPGTFQGHQAVDYTMDADPLAVVAKSVLVDNRMYTLQLARPKSADADSFDRLVESFKLIPGTGSPTPDVATPGEVASDPAGAASPSAAPASTMTVLPLPVPSP